MKKVSIRMGIIPGRLGGPKPKKYYQVQCGSRLKNVTKKSEALKLAKRWRK